MANVLAKIAALFFLCSFLVGGMAQATWKAQYASDPQIAAWFSAQHNQKGEWCCDKSDGHEYDDDYTLNADGSVELQLGGISHHLPAYMVLRGANPTGHAVWWYWDGVGEDGIHRHLDYCFALGTEG